MVLIAKINVMNLNFSKAMKWAVGLGLLSGLFIGFLASHYNWF